MNPLDRIPGNPKANDHEAAQTERSFNRSEAGYVGPTAIIYRSNDFLDNYVSGLTDSIAAQGGEIETHVFPPGTQEEVIDAWYEEHRTSLAGKHVITDWTCAKRVPGARSRSGELDSLITNAIIRTIESEEGLSALFPEGSRAGIASEENWEHHKASTTAFFKLLLNSREPESWPEHVVIVRDHVADHFPVSASFAPAYAQALAQEDARPYQLAKQIEPELAEVIAETVRSAGFPPERIRVVSVDELVQERPGENEFSEFMLTSAPADWIILDRHVTKGADYDSKSGQLSHMLDSSLFESQNSKEDFKRNSERGASGTFLRLPLGDAFSDALAYDLVTYSEEKVRAQLVKDVAASFPANQE